MVLSAPLEGTVIATGLPSHRHLICLLKETMETMKDSEGHVIEPEFPVLGCPPMCPETDFVEFMSIHSFLFSIMSPYLFIAHL
jgi:hypothetical protein